MNRVHRCFVACCTALLMGNSLPAVALADTPSDLQSQINQAQAKLNDLYANAEAVSNELNRTRDDLTTTEASIEETSAQIEEKQSELDVAQKALGVTVAERYKEGNVNLITMIMSSESIDNLIDRVYYANKVSESYSQQIGTVKEIQEELSQEMSSLEEQQSSLEQLLHEQEEQKAVLDAKAGEVQSYMSGLSIEMQNALASRATAQNEAARTQAAARLEAAGGSESTGVQDAHETKSTESEEPKSDAPSQVQPQDQKESEEQTQEQLPTQPESATVDETESTPEDTSDNQEVEATNTDSGAQEVESTSSSGSLSNMDARTAVVNYVLAQIGKPYVWATHGPDSFDCSGLTGAAYDSIGYFIGYSDAYQEQYCNKPASEAVYGDIVWRPGHVGICIGGGVTVEAHTPETGIGYGSIDNFQRSGSPLG